MCGGVYYGIDGEDRRLYFANPRAVLPVRRRDGTHALLPWGRRRGEAGSLPLGGWVRIDSVQAGRWDRWFPVPVKLPLKSFMEQDIEGNAHWFDLTRGKFVQGLVARAGGERRVYVVTIAPEMVDALYPRWPRILPG